MVGGSPRPRQGLWSPGPPFRECTRRQVALPSSRVPPMADMPRSQTPVVSCALAIAPPGLLPSGHWKPSAFPSHLEGYPPVHDYTLFGAPSRGLPPRYTRLRTAPHGEARGFATDLLARRSSGGTDTHWATTTSFMEGPPIPRFRAYLGATSAWLRPARARSLFLHLDPRWLPPASGSLHRRTPSNMDGLFGMETPDRQDQHARPGPRPHAFRDCIKLRMPEQAADKRCHFVL